MPPAAAPVTLIRKELIMATRSRTTFQKRQKEIARAEKQRDKVARRLQRKLNGDQTSEPDVLEAGDEENLVNGVSAVGSSPLYADASSEDKTPPASDTASAPATPAAAVGRT